MILDGQNLLSEDQVITASAGSSNCIDLSEIRDIAIGEQLFAVFVVTEAFTDGSSDSTVAVTLQVDDNSSFTSATDAQVIGTFGALSAIGARLVVPLALDVLIEQYLRAYYTVANGNLSTGKIFGFITKDVYAVRNYASGFLVD